VAAQWEVLAFPEAPDYLEPSSSAGGGSGGEAAVVPVFQPEWYKVGATCAYFNDGQRALCTVVALHPQIPGDTGSYCTVKFVGSGHTRETSLDHLGTTLYSQLHPNAVSTNTLPISSEVVFLLLDHSPHPSMMRPRSKETTTYLCAHAPRD
jgi:hypothetical protein